MRLWCSRTTRQARLGTRRGLLTLLLGTAFFAPIACWAESIPDWMRVAIQRPIPAGMASAKAVVLLSETAFSVRENGDMYSTNRRVVKIQQTSGLSEARQALHFDGETRIVSFKGWSIDPSGREYALKEKDAVEQSPFPLLGSGVIMYDDTRYKILTVPGAAPGAYVAFEAEQRVRPHVSQDVWSYQEDIPVLISTYTVRLPASWEYNYRCINWPEVKPQHLGANDWRWQIEAIPGIRPEPLMPSWRSIAGRMVLSFYSDSDRAGHRIATWEDVSRWVDDLNATRRKSSPEIKQRAAELVAGKTGTLEKIRALAYAVQREIRYAAIEIGIGGYQAHLADATFANKYGDCKDKATLLATMLNEIGVDSYMLLVNTSRGVVKPEAPTAWTFNHAILAIRLPKEVESASLPAVVDHARFGKLLIFDPTDEFTPLGMMHPDMQGDHGLVVAPSGGSLIRLPLFSPPLNRLLRNANLELAPDGTLNGSVQEIRTGYHAWTMRHRLLAVTAEKRAQVLEHFLAESIGSSRLLSASVDNLSKYEDPLVVRYRFEAPAYATTAGDLLLLRPRVLGRKTTDVAEDKDRKYPVEFDGATSLQGDVFEIKLPAGFVVDELPRSAAAKYPFAEYTSTVDSKDNVLRYSRSFTVKDVVVPTSQIAELRALMREIAQDEHAAAILKKVAAPK